MENFQVPFKLITGVATSVVVSGRGTITGLSQTLSAFAEIKDEISNSDKNTGILIKPLIFGMAAPSLQSELALKREK
ncbi:MAG TPA: hypothetical protein VM123_19055 [archaeon]|nr:hypothetical protein [archaeon]